MASEQGAAGHPFFGMLQFVAPALAHKPLAVKDQSIRVGAAGAEPARKNPPHAMFLNPTVEVQKVKCTPAEKGMEAT
jgi:hypothetical protein